jgi:hypothetical protein
MTVGRHAWRAFPPAMTARGSRKTKSRQLDDSHVDISTAFQSPLRALRVLRGASRLPPTKGCQTAAPSPEGCKPAGGRASLASEHPRNPPPPVRQHPGAGARSVAQRFPAPLRPPQLGATVFSCPTRARLRMTEVSATTITPRATGRARRGRRANRPPSSCAECRGL